MNWQEACNQSVMRRAFRDSDRGRFFRDSDGFAIFISNISRQTREALPQEIEGFTDWEPVLPKEEINVKKTDS